ncbi:SH3 domain-containing protein [Sphingorhabdus sp. 109]|jgi:SH3-like domain-containing protein|uniref:SH3 domain-containing protein n=1 Tax=Sphingorhabdus sp. 109 TaxID=2653173 RepID=UPI0012F2A535|nr:SH3 domain-containing protein [Sphingorhabdus sp. 109]VWX57569.1 conserved exported hypothetical protein [Sphingorhabdus sp. 109]
MRIPAFMLVAILGVFPLSPAAAQQQPPYWASIDEPEARMRTGPSTEYPTMWIYKREKLPIKILARYKAWRKVEDHEGTQGWMHARLLSASRTGLVLATNGKPVAMRALPDPDAKIVWRAEPGVVGSLTLCEKGWCLFDVTGRRGYISMSDIWGDEPLK